MTGDPLLRIQNLTIAFGGVRAVDELSFDVSPGTIVSLIGPNGAGKTTVLNSISGFVRATGSIRYRDTELLGRPAYRRASLGIGRTFQNLQLFSSMTLLDNVITGEHAVIGGNVLSDMLRLPTLRRERRARERAMESLRLLGIERYGHRLVDGLPFGVQKLAGVARALSLRPGLLLLDEPAAGLTHEEVSGLSDLIVDLRRRLDVTILLVEHNMRLVMGISDRVVVLDQGRKLAEGTPEEVSANPAVIEAYLGVVEDQTVMNEVKDELTEGM